jgi:NAD(P)-dependent dehydrogenase (short-subunit alcohol dehydrogenase family)
MGRATAQILISLGAEVVAVDLAPVDIDGVTSIHRVDLADPASVDRVVEAVGGGVDALFNCAGVPGTAEERTILAVNFCGTRRFTEGIVGHMAPGSAICTIGSTAAVNWPFHVDAYLELLAIDDDAAALDWLVAHLPDLGYPYDVSKEALNVYTAWRAVSLNELGVRMNCVNPGGTRTPASRDFTTAVKSKAGGEEMLAHWPTLMGRMARPGEQAWPMVFLNSPYASFVNGASIYVDAGLTSGMFTRQHHDAVAAGMFWHAPTSTRPDEGTTQ